MDTAIAIGQGAGFALAAGILLTGLAGIVRSLGIGPSAGIAAVAGAAVGAFWLLDDISVGGIAVGAAAGALAAAAVSPLAGAAARAGSALATGLILAVSAIAEGAASWIPFVGYAFVLVAAFLALRGRRRAGERYEGLRILR